MKSTTTLLQLALIAVLTVVMTGCGSGYGKKIVADGTDVHYQDGASKSDAEQLGRVLKQFEFSDGTKKSVQLQKDGDKWIFRMVVQDEFLRGDAMDKNFELMCLELSSGFDGQQFECHACNDQFETKKTFAGLFGKLKKIGKADFYYNGLTDEQLAAVEKSLTAMQFDGTETTLYFGKEDGGRNFRMVCQPDFYNDAELEGEAKTWIAELSTAVGGDSVVVHLCNEYLEPQNTIK